MIMYTHTHSILVACVHAVTLPPLLLQFGGKLVSFGNTRGVNTPKVVTLSQVVTEHELVQRSNSLEQSLSQQQFGEFCENKSQDSSSEYEKNLWNFLKVNNQC